MLNIECSNIFELAPQADFFEIVESLSTVPVKTLNQELIILRRREDKLYEIPSSVVEMINQEGK